MKVLKESEKLAERKNPEKTPWSQVLLLVGAGVVASFQIGKVPPVLPGIRSDLALSLFQVSWVLSIFNVTGLFLGPVAGALADRLGHRRLLLSGLVIQGAGSFIGALAGTPALLLGTRVLEGLGFLIIATSAPALIFRIVRTDQIRLALGIWSAFVPIGMTLVMLGFPLFLGLSGWRGLWQANALILLGYALVLSRRTRGLRRTAGGPKTGWRHILEDVVKTVSAPGPVVLALIFSTYALQWVTVMGFFPTLLMENRGFQAGSSSFLTAIIVAVNIPGNFMGGWFLQRGLPRWRLIAFSSLIMAAASTVIFISGFPFGLQYLACLIFSGVGGLLPAAVFGGAPVFAPSLKLVATTNGLIVQGSQLGQVMGPPLLAWMVSATGTWQTAPWLLIPAALLGVALSLVLAFLEKKSRPD
ncbi:MAG: MFS transporter [Desulfobacteraceae bacterium]|nr:MAG: MFS transporter [Desulfobacteraceae bacterium]